MIRICRRGAAGFTLQTFLARAGRHHQL